MQGRRDKGGWKQGEERVDDDWEKDDVWTEDEGKWEQKLGRDGRDDRGARVWWGGGYDRRNEMIARGFYRNTYWKEIKEKVEEVMGVSTIIYKKVKVIGERTSFAIIQFDSYENKLEFKKWLSWHGKEVKRERGMWFGDNVDKRTRDREIAVGSWVKALMMAREGRNDVYRDYKQGKVWVGDELVARWEGTSDVIHFRREGKDIRAAYKALRVREGGEEDEFSE